MRVVISDIDEWPLRELSRRLVSTGADVVAFAGDVSESEDVLRLKKPAINAFGTVHLLFNNASVGGPGGLGWQNTEDDWLRTLGVNLSGAVHGVRHFVPLMLEAAVRSRSYHARVVNTASMAGLVNSPLMRVYSASKHAVVSLTETLRYDLLLVGGRVRCSVTCPFFVATSIATAGALRQPSTRGQQIAQP